ncbi:hypothetical protein FRB96_001598 [Tulasnella sp. 330]|nr:hypothetical protein FRB96_001598 [Tulasnella sp. 330]
MRIIVLVVVCFTIAFQGAWAVDVAQGSSLDYIQAGVQNGVVKAVKKFLADQFLPSPKSLLQRPPNSEGKTVMGYHRPSLKPFSEWLRFKEEEAGPGTTGSSGLPSHLYDAVYPPHPQQQAQRQFSYAAYPNAFVGNSYLTMAQMPTLDATTLTGQIPPVDMTSITQPMHGNAAGPNPFFQYDIPGPPQPQVSPFMATLSQVATQEIPNIETLARSALDGINRAYEPDTDPAQTAASLRALRAALGNLYDILKESGVGALPLNPEHIEPEAIMRSGINGVQDPRLEALTEQVNAIFKEGKAARERATVVLDMMQASQGGQSAQLLQTTQPTAFSPFRRPDPYSWIRTSDLVRLKHSSTIVPITIAIPGVISALLVTPGVIGPIDTVDAVFTVPEHR